MKNKGDWMLLLAAFIGGGGFISLKYLLDWGYDPYQVIFGRFLMASAVMCIVYHKRLKKITRKEWKVGTILGVLLAAMFLLMTVGLMYTTPSVNAFLVNIPAVIVPFICWGVFKQKPTKNHFIAALMTLIGVCCLSLTSDFRVDLGAALSLLAAVAFSLQMAFLGNLTDGCDSVHIAIAENISTLVVMAVIVTFTGWDMPALTLPVLGNFAFLGGFCTASYFVLQSIGQQITSPNKAAIIITSESIFAAIFSALLYGERMNIRGYIGCIVIFAAMMLAETPAKKDC
ncbi:MAG: DMT family transporter [Anaerotignum sp.]|nr:DMT family transporter [Anaerotignum sp.]MBR5793696.1 DMT family transporter [Anaerotignum sp.]